MPSLQLKHVTREADQVAHELARSSIDINEVTFLLDNTPAVISIIILAERSGGDGSASSSVPASKPPLDKRYYTD